MTLFNRGISALVVSLAVLAAPAFAQAPLGSGFTYQGLLQNSAVPVNAAADFEFKLFTAATGGAQIGPTQTVSNVNVADGYFTAMIDFGTDSFNSEARFLEVAVRAPSGNGSFVTLTPRQPVTATPYAQFAAKPWDVNGADLSYINGAVGLGTATPQRQLHVFDNNLFTARFESDDPVASVVEFKHTTADATWEFGVAGQLEPFGLPESSMYIYKQGQPKPGLSITPEGLVAIGKKPPILFAKLDVRTEVGVGETIAIYAHCVDGTGVVAGSAHDDGIGLHAYATHSTGVNYAVVGTSYSPNGYDFFASGSGINYGSSSSRRWKHNIELIDDPLGKLSRLRGVHFDWDAEHGGHRDVGMIAEEVGAVLPEIVSYETNGIDAIGMDYSKLTPLLVEAMKQQHARIEDLQEDNAELRDQLATLIERIAKLEARFDAQHE